MFVLAGASAWYSLRTRTLGEYLRERSRRLLLPFVFGLTVFIPWNGYMSASESRNVRRFLLEIFPHSF